MSVFLASVAFLAMIVGLIMLVVNAIKRRPVKPALIVLAAAFVLFIAGAATMPENTSPPGPGNAQTDTPQLAAEDPAAYPAEETQESPGVTTAPAPQAPAAEQETTGDTEAPGTLTVHFIDVDQGDSILVQTPGKNILIDGGSRAAGKTVVNYINEQGIDRLDLVIGTHPHEDHIGGLIGVFQAFPVAEVIDPAVVHTTKTFEEYLTLIDEKDIQFTEGRAGMEWELGGGVKLQVLHPSSPSSSHLNDASIVVKLTFGRVSILFAGDAEQTGLEEMLSKNYDLKSTVLKVSHHGSRTGTSKAFLTAVSPQAAVIMCGKDNSYGHPHDEVLALLAEAKADIYRTDLHGTVIISTDGQRYEVNIKEPYRYNPPKNPKNRSPNRLPSLNLNRPLRCRKANMSAA
ncbi:MAG: ComEC/Rec2 family competence protein [Bacillota bacterium]|jgi:competence protein ComEC|nr:ComEC/Rec2 family competence protein [Bacillota bacterium]HHU30638.1 MBL fold metallo-hydrolase [Bacillota bacterium]